MGSIQLQLPNHIAFIMDGNGRWGLKHYNERVKGHREGLEVMAKTAQQSFKLGIKYVSFYAFSLDNWKRSQDEIDYLHSLIQEFYNREVDKYDDQEVRVVISGFKYNLNQEILNTISNIEERTKKHQRYYLNLCFNYSGRQEIISAAYKYAQDIMQKKIDIDKQLSPEEFHQYLLQPCIPDVDLLVRTSGEQRISDFLLYQSSYAELYFTETLWPDFSNKHLQKALKSYQHRNRKFGKE